MKSFSVKCRPPPDGLSGDALSAWEAAEYMRCAVELARQIFGDDAAEAQTERDANGTTTY